MSTNGVNPLDGREDYDMDEDFSSNSSDEKEFSEEKSTKEELSFQSEDIKERKDHGDLFVNVEGAEQRKRAAQAAALKYAVTKKEATDRFVKDLKRNAEEREQVEAKKRAEAIKQAAAKEEAQKRLLKEETQKAEEAKKTQQEVERAIERAHTRDEKRKLAEQKRIERQNKRAKLNAIFWQGRRKIFTILVVLIIILTPILTIFVIIPAIQRYESDREFNERAESNEKASEIDNSVEIGMYNTGGTEEALIEGEEAYKKEIAGLSGRDKLYATLRYARFVFNHTSDSKRAVKIAEEVKDLPSNDQELIDYYACIRDIYDLGGYHEEAEKYNKLIIDLMPPFTPGDIDSYGGLKNE